MLFSPGALLRFSLFIDCSTSDGSMDGGSIVEVVVGSLRVSCQLKLFLSIQFFVEFNTSLHDLVFIMNVHPISFHE